MLEAINEIVGGNWGFEMVDGKVDLTNVEFLKDGKTAKIKYYPFTQKEAIEMSQALGNIYQIAHCVHCKSCTPNLKDSK